ncbi:MAG: 50S ribosomal protein L3 [Nitrososphaerota archaeon]|nr:50S ribosomal protein L3 [Nitrososphaerota archaeon]MDG6924346.1 50S ribosomal protein L3 [Nitrososphaerota archaeon]
MGHRKHSTPRRGSLAFAPRARHHTLIPRVRNWTERGIEKPTLAAFPVFKVGMIHVVTLDDREKTPNFGKPMFNPATLLSAPSLSVYGLRAYGRYRGIDFAYTDVFAGNMPEEARKRISNSIGGKDAKPTLDSGLKKVEELLPKIDRFAALVGVTPAETGLSNTIPQVQEVGITGGDVKSQFEYLKGILGKTIKASDYFKPGSFVDTIAITKGKGFEGVITRFGVKRKQHKSRKTVREVGVISPWHPATVMYTVPRAGQMGFHQRMDKNKRILVVANAQQVPITPRGGFPHFGDVRGEYLIVRGSVPGPIKRLIDLRLPLYPRKQKVQAPKILEINVTGSAVPLVSTAK